MDKYQSMGGPSEGPKGPHSDYRANLLQAEQFCKNVAKALLPGMFVKIAGSHGLDQSILLIGWTPPMEAKIGKYGTNISLHQSKGEFSRQVEWFFNAYLRFVREWQEGKQPNFLEAMAL